MPVLAGERLVGMVTLDNVSELLMVQTALRERQRRDRGPRARERPRA
jgi:hypothetical protein